MIKWNLEVYILFGKNKCLIFIAPEMPVCNPELCRAHLKAGVLYLWATALL